MMPRARHCSRPPASASALRRAPGAAGRALLLLLLLLLVPGPAVTADTGIAIDVATLSRDGWTARGISLRYPFDDAGPGLVIGVDALQPPGDREPLTDIRIHCSRPIGDATALRCRDPAARVTLPGAGTLTVAVDAEYARDSGALAFRLEGLAVGDGEATLEGGWAGTRWRLSARLQEAAIPALRAFLAPDRAAGWSAGGNVSGELTVTGRDTSPTGLSVELRGRDVAFASPDGLRAGEALGAGVTARLRPSGGVWAGQLSVSADAGQLYVDPVFTDLGTHPLRVSGDVVHDAAAGTTELLDLTVAQTGVLQVRGHAVLTPATASLRTLTVPDARLTFPAAYTTYLQPFLGGTAAADLKVDGTVTGRIDVADGRPVSAALETGTLDLADNGDAFGVSGLEARLSWAAAERPPPPPSRLSWSSGDVHGIPLGPAALAVELHGRDIALAEPGRVPLLDGALMVRTFAVRRGADGDRQATLDAELEPVSLGPLTSALGWPALGGTLSGRLPSLVYRDGVATLGGAFRAAIFGGRVTVADLRLRDPFSGLPELRADVQLDDLELGTITETFSFGRITGRLQGRIDGLRLVGWQPAAFDAWFANPPDDTAPHRISQRAVENLANLGGGGGAGVVSRGLLGFFDSFAYDRLGLGCVLRGNVCRMRGLGPAERGYYIVRGAGLPRVDVIGHVREVSWSTLLSQLASATASSGPVVR